jgi:hypothetical protein
MATLEESLQSINLVEELLRSSEIIEHLPEALRRRVSKVLRDFPSTAAVARALEPREPNISHELMSVLIDARTVIEYIAVYFGGPLDRGLVNFALRSYPDTSDLVEAVTNNKFPRSTLEAQTYGADVSTCGQKGVLLSNASRCRSTQNRTSAG